MSDQNRLNEILADYRLAIDQAEQAAAAARSAAESKQRDLIRAHPDLADELQKHFLKIQRREDEATVSLSQSQSDTASVAEFSTPNRRSIRPQVDILRDDFELAWRQGDEPELSAFLSKVTSDERTLLFRELLPLELHYRRQAGENPTPEDYRLKYSDFIRWVDEAFLSEATKAPSPENERLSAEHHFDTTIATGETRIETVGSRDRSFGDYELLEEVAKGGMGVVYKARQVGLDRIVALKMIRSGELAHEEEVERFHTEARAAAKLEHSGILPIYEIGERDSQHFFTMAFVEGGSLQDLLVDGPLPPKKAAELVQQTAEAMQHAHEQGIVHRDLKPANILMDRDGHPKIADFGLAKRLEEDSGLTASGTAMGTPSYMPPEQALGKGNEIGPLADVYALGAVLYCSLTGRPPFAADNYLETIRHVLDKDPVPPRSLNPAIPKDLETICLKCLRKEQRNRYQSADELADDLQRWLSSEPIKARRVGRLEKSWLWCRRRPVVAGLLAVMVAVLVAVVIGGVMIRHAVERGRQELLAEQKVEQRKVQAAEIVQGLLQADTSQVKTIIGNLDPDRQYVEDDLKTAFAESPANSNAKLHAALALLSTDKSVLPALTDRLLTVTPMQFEHVRDLLEDNKNELVGPYWEKVKTGAKPEVRFQAACALASYDSDNEYWQNEDFQTFVAGHLVGVRPSELLPWTNALRPVKDQLINALTTIYRNQNAGEQLRSFATDVLTDYLSDDANGLFDLLADANDRQFAAMFSSLESHREKAVALGNAEIARSLAEDASEQEEEALAMRQANAAVMLLRMGAAEQVWPLLKHSPDPRVRSYIIHWLRPRGGDFKAIIARYEQEKDVTVKRALLLCLGEFQLTDSEQQTLIETLLTVYRSDPDAGLHAAAEWLLRQWKQGELLDAIDKELQQKEEELLTSENDQRQWYVNSQGQTFVILDAGEFLMGTPVTDADRSTTEMTLHRREINRRVAVATKEVTRAQWRTFYNATKIYAADQDQFQPYVRSDDSPMVALTWYEAAIYCNWLSEQEGIPEEQRCYEKNEEDLYGPGMKAKENFLELTGYRLPTEAEWEYACRAGSNRRRYYGESDELLPRYAWYQTNSETRTHPVASLKPNDFGLFDMQGNVYEWCYEAYATYSAAETIKDAPPIESVEDTDPRVMRGGAFTTHPSVLRSAFRMDNRPAYRMFGVGFRPVRTYHQFP